MIRVLLADDHQLIREGLKQILAETSDIKVVDEAENGRAVLEKVRQSDFDLILLDISLPGRCRPDRPSGSKPSHRAVPADRRWWQNRSISKTVVCLTPRGTSSNYPE